MQVLLFPLGIVIAAVGFIAIGFGIPDKAFSFGNTLIIAGTVAAMGGLILIALASVVAQLRRIAESGAMHAPMMQPESHIDESFQPGMQTGVSARPDVPLRPSYQPETPEPAKSAVSSTEEAEHLAWLRPKSTTPTFGEQALIAEMEASLAPPSSPPITPNAPRLVNPNAAVNPPSQTKSPAPLSAPEQNPFAGMVQRGESAQRSSSLADQFTASKTFETVWPETKPIRNPETVARAQKPMMPQPSRDMGAISKEPPITTSTQSMPQGFVSEPAAALTSGHSPPPSELRPVAVLKSGVIDGMSYTLYVDGSIEAVLASGPIKFASIDALRMHLEKNA